MVSVACYLMAQVFAIYAFRHVSFSFYPDDVDDFFTPALLLLYTRAIPKVVFLALRKLCFASFYSLFVL